MLAKIAGAAILYLALAKLSQILVAQPVTHIVWFPAGLGLAQVLMGGNRYLFGIFIAAFVASLIDSTPVGMTLIFAGTATFQSFLGAWLFKRNNHIKPGSGQLVDLQKLIVLSGVLPTLFTAILGTGLLWLSQYIAASAYLQTVVRWWMGDLLGIILVAPLAVMWKNLIFDVFPNHASTTSVSPTSGWLDANERPEAKRLIEAGLILGASFLAGQIIFFGWFNSLVGEYARGYFMFLMVALASLKLGRQGTFVVLLMVAIQGLWGARLGVGMFAQDAAETGLLGYWLYMVTLSMVGLTLASYIASERTDREVLREQMQFFQLITENIDDLIAVLDLQGHRLYNSPSYGRLFGDPHHLFLTNSFQEVHPDDRELVRNAFKETVKTGVGQRIEFRFILPDQSVRFMESRGGVVRNSKGELQYIVVVSHDITERKQAEEVVRSRAYYDALTQIPNRYMLHDRLAQAMRGSKRGKYYGAIMMLDLDNFKPLNDKCGHAVGDLLLVEVARRLARSVRQMDTVARLGGDEFVVLLSALDQDLTRSLEHAHLVAQKIQAGLSDSYCLPTGKVEGADSMVTHHCTSSIGVTLFYGDEVCQEDILNQADTAMYAAKENGRNQICFHKTS